MFVSHKQSSFCAEVLNIYMESWSVLIESICRDIKSGNSIVYQASKWRFGACLDIFVLDLRRESYVIVKGLFEVRLIVFFLRGLVDCIVSLNLVYLLVCFGG